MKVDAFEEIKEREIIYECSFIDPLRLMTVKLEMAKSNVTVIEEGD